MATASEAPESEIQSRRSESEVMTASSTAVSPLHWAIRRVSMAIRLLEAYFRVVGICIFVLWSKFLYTFFPQVQRRVLDTRMEHRPKRMWTAIKSEEEWGKNFFATTEMIKNRYKAWIQEPYREALVNSAAPNPMVVLAKSGEKVPLLSLAKEGRPLILNFGSCT